MQQSVSAAHVAPVAKQAGGVTPPPPSSPQAASRTASAVVTRAALVRATRAVGMGLLATEHVVNVPEHAPAQPANAAPAAGVAVRVTTVPAANGAAHVGPQVIPAGADVTVPIAGPALTTVRTGLAGASGAAASMARASTARASDSIGDAVLQAAPISAAHAITMNERGDMTSSEG